MHIVAFLNDNIDDKKLAMTWQKKGLLVMALSEWYAKMPYKKGLVIGFTNIKSEEVATKHLKKVKNSI